MKRRNSNRYEPKIKKKKVDLSAPSSFIDGIIPIAYSKGLLIILASNITSVR